MKQFFMFCCLFLSINAFTQVAQLDSLLVNKQYIVFERELSKMHIFNKDSNMYWYYYGKLYTRQRNLKKAFLALKKVDTTQLSERFKGWYYYVLGDTYRYSNQEEKAYELKLQAQELFRLEENEKMVNEINYDLHYTLVSQDFLEYDGESYLRDYLKIANKNRDKNQLLKAHLVLSLKPELTSEKIHFHLKEATQYAYTIGTIASKYMLHNYKAIYYQNRGNNFEKAKIHVDSMLYYAKILDAPDRLDSALKTKASWFRLQKQYKKAATMLLKAESLPIRENIYNRKRHLYQYLAYNYEGLGEIDTAFGYYKKMVSYRDSVNISKQNTILTLLETVELSKKNLEIDAARIKNKNQFILSLLAFIVAVIIGTVFTLYYRKKKQLAEKEKELKAIDARNEEKDRQRKRIAEELHDNLGGLIVAIKQSFDNLKAHKDHFQQEEDNLISKTRELLDEAYKKVRHMAHLEESASRNSGYWVNVIKDFAAIINESNQLSVEVQSYGAEHVFNMSTEKDLRHMTTELITNAIKHAKATEISVDITANEDTLTIIVEDNGIGLDKAQLEHQKGLGLYSIQKKAEGLKGTLTIDSTLNKGTTFIIEIPL